jgi:16S rRNA (uracil1498-N3)-methyltransferase
LWLHRFFAERTGENRVRLLPEEARHAVTVLRLKEGDAVQIILEENLYSAEIVSVQDGVWAELEGVLPSPEPSVRVTLVQGLPKADKMDWIVQKATELGVSRIIPIAMERSVVRLSEADGRKKTERWQKISREAGKQCGRCFLPEICLPLSIEQLTAKTDLPALNVVPWEEADRFGPLALHNAWPKTDSLGILIGPEGGISSREIGMLKSGGFLPMTLGKRILRTETAGIAAVASLMCLYGEME